MALTAAQRAVILTGSRPAWVTGMDMAWDLVGNRTWTANPITDTHSAAINAQYQNGSFAPFAANTLVDTDLGLQTVPTRTNSLRNNSMSGAVAGSPGTAPTNWTASAQTGYAWQLVATGTEFGLPYIDYRLSGTDALSRANNIIFETSTGITAANGETWTHSSFARIIAGSLTGVTTTLQMDENTSVGGFVANGNTTIVLTSSFTRYSFTRTLAGGATVARVQPFMRFTTSAGATVDLTVRIYAPQMELGAFASAPILTTSGAAAVNGNQQVATVPTITSGVGVIVQVNLLNLVGLTGPKVVEFNDGVSSNNSFIIEYESSGANFQVRASIAGVNTAVPFVPSTIPSGLLTIAAAVGNNFVMGRIVGQAAPTAGVSTGLPSGMNRMSIGGRGYDAARNSYQLTRRMAVKFGAQDASTFADLFAKATLLAAVS